MIPLVSKKVSDLVEEGKKDHKKAKSEGKSEDEIDEMLTQIHPRTQFIGYFTRELLK